MTQPKPGDQAPKIPTTGSGVKPAASAERAIVERLAAMDEPLCESGYGDTDCALCGAHRPYDAHDADCPWQAARNLVNT